MTKIQGRRIKIRKPKHAQTGTNQALNFFDLSPELRNMVYKLLLPAPGHVDINSNNICPVQPINKQYRDEANSMYLQNNTFSAKISSRNSLRHVMTWLTMARTSKPIQIARFDLHIPGVLYVNLSADTGTPNAIRSCKEAREARCLARIHSTDTNNYEDIQWEVQDLLDSFGSYPRYVSFGVEHIARILRIVFRDSAFYLGRESRPGWVVLRRLRSFYTDLSVEVSAT